MTDDCVISIVDGLMNNKTLEGLDLSNNSDLSQSGRAAVDWLERLERAHSQGVSGKRWRFHFGERPC
jgi:hypothetical protein